MYRRRQLLALIAVVGLLLSAPVRSAWAQLPGKPAAVVSIAGVDKLLADIGYLTRAAGTPDVGGLVTLMAGQYIQGLNTKQPIGLLFEMVGPRPSVVAFVPVSDFETVLTKIEESLGEPEDVGNGVKKLSLQREIFFKHREGWAFISDSEANLDGLPRDPAAALGTLPTKYDVAVQVNVQSIPAELRDKAVTELREGFERGLENASDGDEKQREFQEKFGRQAIEQYVSYIEEADQITLGWGTDSNKGGTFLDIEFTAREGTSLANRFGLLEGNSTDFAGFLLPNAATRLHFTSKASADDIEQAKVALQLFRQKTMEEIEEDDDLPDDQARAKAKEIVESLFAVIEETLEGGKFDGGGVLLLEDGGLQLVAGGLIADGGRVEAELRRAIELSRSIEDDPHLDSIRFDASSHQGVDFHTATVPIPEDEEDARKVLGDQLEIVVGTGDKSIYVAMGRGCQALLKRVIDESKLRSGADATPATFDIALGPILEFAAAIENKPEVKMMAEALRESNGKDHISVRASTIPRGAAYRVHIEEGVLTLIGQAAKMR